MPSVAMLMPHFPSQTHTFYWREIRALRELGIEVLPLSTTRPPDAEICHPWSAQAQSETIYLTPPSLGALAGGLWRLLLGGPRDWLGCLGLIREVRDASAMDKARLVALIPIGAIVAHVAVRRRIGHLHAHSCGQVAWICLIASRLARITYSLTLHGPLEHYGPGQETKWLHASFGIAVTERLKDQVLEAIPTLDAAKIEVASMGVELDRFVRSTPYNPPSDGEPWRLVTCGRLHPGKGHADLIEAVSILRRDGFDCELQILGDGPARQDLQTQISEASLQDFVMLRGAVSEDEVREALEQAHLFALASHDEAIGVATMEAMAMELPIVVTHVGGVPELVCHDQNGLLVPPQQPAEMARAIREALGDASKASRLGKAARETIVDRFGADVSARAIAGRLGVGSVPGNVRSQEGPCVS